MGDKQVKPLEEWLLEGGFSQRALAEKADVSQSIISQVVSGGRSSLRAETMKKIADALGVEIRQVEEFDQVIKARLGKETALATAKPTARVLQDGDSVGAVSVP